MVPRAAIQAYRLLWRHGLAPTLVGGPNPFRRPLNYMRYWQAWRTYAALPDAERLSLLDSFPQVEDSTASTAVEAHYFNQNVWAARLIAATRPALHVDVGSDHRLVGMLTSVTKVAFTDIRPLVTHLPDLMPLAGSVLRLPFQDQSVASLSCLHVAEHIGLGRYGDALNPAGTREAAAELARVLAPKGRLYFSVPVGRPRVEFNAHRVHTPAQIIQMFGELDLESFAAEDDAGTFLGDADPSALASAHYACGMFFFVRAEHG